MNASNEAGRRDPASASDSSTDSDPAPARTSSSHDREAPATSDTDAASTPTTDAASRSGGSSPDSDGRNTRTTEATPDDESGALIPEDCVQILDADGGVRPGATEPDLSSDELLAMYEAMVLARRFDERALALQRQGRLATYAPMAGQVGSQVATSFALATDDWLFPTYRDHAAKFVHGMDFATQLEALRGHPDGYAAPQGVHVTPEYIPIATQIPQAVGAGWAAKLRGDDRAVMCYLGDGATSEGDFHEGLNVAGVFDTPTVFVCNNNQWAISVPRERQTASRTLAEKAHAYGFEGVRVDGMDPLAVYAVTRRALAKARDPDAVGGDSAPGRARRPTLVESVQYRYGAHTTSDDPGAYRDEDEVERWRDYDPLDRLEGYLRNRGILTDARKTTIEARADRRVEAAVEAAETTVTEPDELFEHVYASPTGRLDDQRAELRGRRDRHDDPTTH